MRKATIREQRARGRKSLAVLPIHYPVEILTALDIHAVELWGPPGPPRGPDAGRVQTYVCAIVRNALAFLAGGHADDVDGVLFPHTCDSIQGLATLAVDFGGWSKASFTYLHAKGENRPSARRFARAELESLASELSEWVGKELDPAALTDAIHLHRRIDAAKAALVDGRARLAMDDTELYALLRRGEYLWPEDHLRELEAAKDRLSDHPVQRGVPLMITGYVPEPASIFETLNDAGAYVVADDYAAVGRRIHRRHADTLPRDPFDALVELAFSAPPCSTRSADQGRRVAWLAHLYGRSGAAGLIMHMIKFCEPELFDVAAIRKRFTDQGSPVLYLEGELERELSGQGTTRIEAFVEMVEKARRAA